MGGMAAEEGMEPGWCRGSSSVRAASVLLFWGMRLGVPGGGMRCQGLRARATLGLLVLLGAFGWLFLLALHKAPSLLTEPAVG